MVLTPPYPGMLVQVVIGRGGAPTACNAAPACCKAFDVGWKRRYPISERAWAIRGLLSLAKRTQLTYTDALGDLKFAC